MNSASERPAGAAGFSVLALLGLLGLALVSAGCADHGPTSLYSQPLFGVTQSGAQLAVSGVQEQYVRTDSSGNSVDGFTVYLKNVGRQSTFATVTAALSSGDPAAAQPLTTGAQVSPQAVYGPQGQEIHPGDTAAGYAVDSNGVFLNNGYSYEVAFKPGGGSVHFTVTATDAYGKSWVSGFDAAAQ